ncbi:MAG: cation transporter [Phycisphaeraceae bacterium]|nr:cation transporter [Phycisphaeraceae bacterium]
MPDPQAGPHAQQIRRVALRALAAGIVITLLKFGLFAMTVSVAVLSDALESIINIAAAGMMCYAVWYANRPADRDHPYGHGKVEFLAVGLEGWLILTAAVIIAYEAIRRLIWGHEVQRLTFGVIGLAVLGVATAALAIYVMRAGKQYESPTLAADGKHLMTDSISTWAVFLGLLLVRWTGKMWLDPVVAIIVAGCILFVSWRLLWQSVHGLMDRQDPADDKRLRAILDDEVSRGAIKGYHKLRHRHSGSFHWVDMHLQVDGNMTVTAGHELASRIEGRIERELGQANATAHIEPTPGSNPSGASSGAAEADSSAVPSTAVNPSHVDPDQPLR